MYILVIALKYKKIVVNESSTAKESDFTVEALYPLSHRNEQHITGSFSGKPNFSESRERERERERETVRERQRERERDSERERELERESERVRQ